MALREYNSYGTEQTTQHEPKLQFTLAESMLVITASMAVLVTWQGAACSELRTALVWLICGLSIYVTLKKLAQHGHSNRKTVTLAIMFGGTVGFTFACFGFTWAHIKRNQVDHPTYQSFLRFVDRVPNRLVSNGGQRTSFTLSIHQRCCNTLRLTSR